MSTERAVPLEEAGGLVQHVVEVPALLAAGRPALLPCIGSHTQSTADPLAAASSAGAGQRLPDPARAHPGNEGKPAWDGTSMIAVTMVVSGAGSRPPAVAAGSGSAGWW